MISRSLVQYSDTHAEQSKTARKKGFFFCVCASCNHASVCAKTPLCEWKKVALKAILLLWSLWWNLWRGKARGLFCKSGQSLSLCERLHLPLLNTRASLLHQTAGQKDMIFTADSSTFLKQPRQNISLIVCKAICLSGRALVLFLGVLGRFVRQSVFVWRDL